MKSLNSLLLALVAGFTLISSGLADEAKSPCGDDGKPCCCAAECAHKDAGECADKCTAKCEDKPACKKAGSKAEKK